MTEHNKENLKSISQLKGVFNIPAYQRGYRWGRREIETFLADIKKAFENGEEQYFLQAIVVKQSPEIGTEDGKNVPIFELIDGQQRLTTAWLLYGILRKYSPDTKPLGFTLTYESRKGSGAFLNKLVQENSAEAKLEADKNVDYWHMYNAVNIIVEWAKQQDRRATLLEYFLYNVKILWHEDEEEIDPATHFVSLNSGRIPLQDAELCRALLLTGKYMDVAAMLPPELRPDKHGALTDSAKAAYTCLLKSRQLQLGLTWDQIERELREDAFWGFLNGPKDQAVYMNYLLNIIFDTSNDVEQYPCYNGIEEKFSSGKGKKNALDIWNDIVFRFDRLDNWYRDNEYYHWLGYLCAVQDEHGSIHFWNSKLCESINKSEDIFKENLKDEIRNTISDSCDRKNLDLSSYTYERKETRNLLLLFNVEYAKRAQSIGVRFPFFQHNSMKWSLEHINAQQTEFPQDQKVWREWLRLQSDFLTKFNIEAQNEKDEERSTTLKKLLHDCKKYLRLKTLHQAEFEMLRKKIVDFIGLNTVRQNDLCNLALLDISKNAALNNSVFAIKREQLRSCLTEGQNAEDTERNTIYIPLGTQAVFMRHFTPDASSSPVWSEEDMAGYEQALKSILSYYWPGLKNQPSEGEE